MLALWRDPFAAAMLKQSADHLGDLRQTRLLAEDAATRLDQALSEGGDPATLQCLLVGSRLLDYAGERFQTAPELEKMWRNVGPRRPKDDEWWNDFESQVTYQDHSRIIDLMDAITELRPSTGLPGSMSSRPTVWTRRWSGGMPKPNIGESFKTDSGCSPTAPTRGGHCRLLRRWRGAAGSGGLSKVCHSERSEESALVSRVEPCRSFAAMKMAAMAAQSDRIRPLVAARLVVAT